MASKPRVSANDVRQQFVDFFVARDHTRVPSSSLVPARDPTLLFTNAGMVQFKDVFLGRETRPYSRAVSVQRCLRAGGKHNDLENVGFTPRHQTMFEMLGNFSFGDYFKRDAIKWGWELLTEGYGFSPERLVVSVYNGEGEAAPADDEAFELWTELLPADRIYRFDAKENFWMMADTGPCGPNSEIHLFKGDRAPGDATRDGAFGPAHQEDLYLELWNLVFMQYEKLGDGTLEPLPKPAVDTGAGLERIVAGLAGAASNYETDLLSPLVAEARRLAGAEAHDGKGAAPFHVIADHARATAFLIADGVFPDKTGRSYVLRRIMRRAIRFGTEVGLDEPFFHQVCARVVEEFGDVYPELAERAATISEVVQAEEEAFRRTLARGLKRLGSALGALDAGTKQFPPAVAADLYDTYGFPLDLTGLIVREHDITLDEAAAEAEVRNRQGAGDKKLGQDTGVADLYFKLHEQVGASEFVGYEVTSANAEVMTILRDGAPVDHAEAGDTIELVADRTPFYAESGGQIGDTGTATGDGFEVEITDAQEPVAGLVVHGGRVTNGRASIGARVRLSVDVGRRDAIRRNHSATHLLHHALREVIGAHVIQKGSLVAPDRLRFDYSHNRPMTADQRAEIERMVNAHVLANHDSETRLMTIEDAKQAGAIGLFEAKYGEQVRVVGIGSESLELCGGTHVGRAGDIGLFKIVSEGGIAQGVRRVEAVTGMGAVDYVQGLESTADAATDQLKASSFDEVPERIAKLQGDVKARTRTIEELQRKLATGGAAASDPIVDVAGVKLLAKRVAVGGAKTLREAADSLRDKLGSGVVVLGAENEGKATLLVAVTKDLAGRVHAGKLVGKLAVHVDGRGGGRPDLAQAGGPKAAGLDDAIDAAEPTLAAQLGA